MLSQAFVCVPQQCMKIWMKKKMKQHSEVPISSWSESFLWNESISEKQKSTAAERDSLQFSLMNVNLNHQYYTRKKEIQISNQLWRQPLDFKALQSIKTHCMCSLCAQKAWKSMVYMLRFKDVMLYWCMELKSLVQIHIYSNLGLNFWLWKNDNLL